MATSALSICASTLARLATPIALGTTFFTCLVAPNKAASFLCKRLVEQTPYLVSQPFEIEIVVRTAALKCANRVCIWFEVDAQVVAIAVARVGQIDIKKIANVAKLIRIRNHIAVYDISRLFLDQSACTIVSVF